MTKLEEFTRLLSSSVLGIEYDDLYENKTEWIDDRGSRHDINVPYKGDLRDAAQEVIDWLAKEIEQGELL